MLFATPIWLIGLVPWAVLAAVLLLSRRPSTYVPFLDFWKLNAPQESIRRSFSTPPIGVVLALLAALLAVLAAGGPALRRPGTSAIVVIVDCGSAMSAADGDRPRFAAAGDRLAATLKQTGVQTVELIALPAPPGTSPGSSRTTVDDLGSAIAGLPLSAVDVSDMLERQVRQSLSTDARVIVVTDRAFEAGGGDRVAFVTPVKPPEFNAGIRQLAVRRTPSPQVMVSVAWAGGQPNGAIELRISTAGQNVSRQLDLTSGPSAELFVPLPAVGDVVTAELLGPGGNPLTDAFAGDNRADVVADRNWPVIEPAVAVGELQRLIDIYARARPGGARSTTVRLTPTPAQLGESSGVVLAAWAGVSRGTTVATAADHPAVATVDLSQVALPAAVERSLPAGSWTAVLSDAAGPLLAVRELTGPAGEAIGRQAWTAIDPRGWADQVAYVIFWSAIFDWVGGVTGDGWVGDRLLAWPLASLGVDWTPVERAPGGDRATFWPGVYQRRGDGLRRAFGPAAFAPASPPAVSGSDDAGLENIRRLVAGGERHAALSPWLIAVALGVAAAAAGLWRRRPRHNVHP